VRVNLTRCQVDTPCWQYAELHEILHDLGAVQPDAPTPSAAGHCTDEADVMCYDDGSGPTVVTTVCPPEHEALVDCGHGHPDQRRHLHPPSQAPRPGTFSYRVVKRADTGHAGDQPDADGDRSLRLRGPPR
jgi:hypothetical protein